MDRSRKTVLFYDRQRMVRRMQSARFEIVCKQNQPLLSSHLHDNCVVKLLQPRSNIPQSCDKRIVEIYNSVWTQLDNNEWIYFVPSSESMTLETLRTRFEPLTTGARNFKCRASNPGQSFVYALSPTFTPPATALQDPQPFCENETYLVSNPVTLCTRITFIIYIYIYTCIYK
jgi:hypothetical protein